MNINCKYTCHSYYVLGLGNRWNDIMYLTDKERNNTQGKDKILSAGKRWNESMKSESEKSIVNMVLNA